MKNFKKGFTLIELLVVISIIGVLTALLLSNFVGIRERAKDTELKSNLRQLKTALRLYYNDNQSYPAASGSTFNSCGSTNAPCSAGDIFNNMGGGTTYMKSFPEIDGYQQPAGDDTFKAYVTLNNASDADADKSALECGSPPGSSIYYVCAD